MQTAVFDIRDFFRKSTDVETVSSALRSAILEGKDVNLALRLIPRFDLGEYSHYAGVGGLHLLHPLFSDSRLNHNLTLPELICVFNKYHNSMCEAWDRRQELDAYEAIVIGIRGLLATHSMNITEHFLQEQPRLSSSRK